jgi:hypothetical protein
MAERDSGGQSATIIAAAIGVVGVLGAALISNWGNIFPRTTTNQAVVLAPQPANSATEDQGGNATSSGSAAGNPNGGATQATSDNAIPPTTPSWPDVSGTWNDGSEEWDITQNGNQVTAGDYVVTISSNGTFSFQTFTAAGRSVPTAAAADRIDTHSWTLRDATTLMDHMTVETRQDVTGPFGRQPQLDRVKTFTRIKP